MSNMKLMFATIALASSVVFGGEIVVAENAEGLEGRTESAESVEETIGTPGSTASGIIGSVEVRPSLNPNGAKPDEYHTENNVILGYKFSANNSVMYRQEFNTNISDSTPGGAQGLNPLVKDGIFIAKFNNIWTNAPAGLAFSYEPRVYLPTDLDKRNAGMVSTVRQYLKLTKVVNDNFSLTFIETPILMLYNNAGYQKADGTATANPFFENRVYLVADINFTKDLALSVPVIFNNTRFSAYASSGYGDTWINTLWTYPELTYNVNDHLTVGMGYVSENLLSYTPTGVYQGFDMSSGFSNGTVQAILSARL
jgi:hypothetical protein